MTRYRKPGPIPVYLGMVTCGNFAFMTWATMSAVYRIQEAGLDPIQLILVGTVLEISVFLFEVPTGVVADVHSRRLSLIIGYAMIGIGLVLEGALPVFATILVAQAIWGIGYTFTSGARQAWLADELEDGVGAGRIFLKGAQLEQIGALAGIALSVVLATISVALPLIVGGIMFGILAVALVVIMPERGFSSTPPINRTSWREMRTTFAAGVTTTRTHPVLMAIIAIELFTGASSEPFDRLWTLHMLEIFEFPSPWGLNSLVWFGVIGAGALLIGTILTWFIRRMFDVDEPRTPRRLLAVTNASVIASTLVFALSGSFALAVSMVIATTVLRRISEPVADVWLIQHTESAYRATVFSLRGQANAFAQVALGPAMGILAVMTTLRTALVGASTLLAPSQVIYALLGERQRN